METEKFKFGTFFWRITSSHMITYFVMGIIAANLLFDSSDSLRAYDSPWIAAGVALQVIRGLIISLALWYFKQSFLLSKIWMAQALGIDRGIIYFVHRRCGPRFD